MFLIIKDVWNWIVNSAWHQFLFTVLALLIAFLVLLKYPISFTQTKYEIKDYITTTSTSQYVVRTELTKDGAKVSLCTKTYYAKVCDKKSQ